MSAFTLSHNLLGVSQSHVRIVLVDDSQEDLILTHRVFRKCKLLSLISTFGGGKEFIDYIKGVETGDSQKLPEPMIIFVDLKMPQVNGFEVLSFLRDSQFGPHSLVVMLSGVDDLKTLSHGYKLGAKTFLVKPVTKRDISHLLNSWEDHIIIEETDHGYHVHWKERLKHEPHIVRKSSQIEVCSA